MLIDSGGLVLCMSNLGINIWEMFSTWSTQLAWLILKGTVSHRSPIKGQCREEDAEYTPMDAYWNIMDGKQCPHLPIEIQIQWFDACPWTQHDFTHRWEHDPFVVVTCQEFLHPECCIPMYIMWETCM